MTNRSRWFLPVALLSMATGALAPLQSALAYTDAPQGGYCSDDDGPLDELAGELFLFGAVCAAIGTAFGATAPWWGPRKALDHHDPAIGFPHHPYEDSHGGFLVEDSDFETIDRLRLGEFFARGNIDWGSDYDGVERLGANFHLETVSKWGFDGEWARYTIDRAKRPGVIDYQTGDANLIYRFAESTRAHWWTGAGFNWYQESGTPSYGYNLTYGVDVCLGDPWMLSAQFDAGEIEHQAYFRGRTTIGVQWQGVELFTGFDYFDHRNHSDGTLIAGVRAWF